MTTPIPEITVHWLDKSRAQRILWLLEELQLPYTVKLYHREGLTAPASLRAVHPLGKAPIVTIAPGPDAPPGAEPLVLAETGFITSYLCAHFAGRADAPATSSLVPPKWRDGMEGRVAGETAAWLRHEYLLHYTEGSLFPVIIVKLLLDMMSSSRIPFFIRPVSSFVAGKLVEGYVFPNAKAHLAMLEDMLKNAPGGGDGGGYLCGAELTAVDVLMGFTLLAAKSRFANAGQWEKGSIEKEFPTLWAYAERLENEEGYKRSVDKVKELNGGRFSAL